MGKVMEEAAVERFRRDGFYAPLQVASHEEALQMRAHLEAYENEHGGPLKGSARFKSHLLFKWLAEFIRSPRVLDPVEDVIGPRHHGLVHGLVAQGGQLPELRLVAPGQPVLGARQREARDGVGGAVAIECRQRMHALHAGLAPGAGPAPPRDLPRRQPAHPRAGDHRRHRRVEGGERRARAWRGFDLRLPHRAQRRTPTAPTTAASGSRFASSLPMRARSGPTTTAWRSCAASTRTATSSSSPSRSATSTPPRVEFHRWAEEERRKILYHGTDWQTHRT